MKKDTVTKDYMSDAAVFADAFNYYIYGGELVIQPGHLMEWDSAEIYYAIAVKNCLYDALDYAGQWK